MILINNVDDRIRRQELHVAHLRMTKAPKPVLQRQRRALRTLRVLRIMQSHPSRKGQHSCT